MLIKLNINFLSQRPELVQIKDTHIKLKGELPFGKVVKIGCV